MRCNIRSWSAMALLLLLTFGFSWAQAQCPEAPDDRGECDTLNVICLDCERTEGEPGPYSVRFPLLITHDQTEAGDSIAGFAIPLAYTHTNPSAYCSVSGYWNETPMGWYFPQFPRSIFRHMFETDYPAHSADTLYRNRMAMLEGDFSGRGWDMTILDLDGTSHFWLTVVPTGPPDQRWWESDRVLLATMTMRIEDTMHVCVDTTFWPPATSVTFSRSDAVTYVPRDNMPNCFWVGPPLPPDFAIDAEPDTQEVVAGNSVDYDVIVTSLNGFSSLVDLSVTDLPPDASADFDPDPVTPTDTSVMTVTTAATTPEGTYTLTVTGTEITKAQIEHSTEVVLKVITPEAVTVTAPNGGEVWCVGSTENITWTFTGIDTVKIEYSTDAGSSWMTEVDKTPAAPGTYSWTVPDAPSVQCLVKICDAEDGTPCDQSDAVFTIKAAPAAPSDCIASDDLCDKVQFTWTDNSANEAGFHIFRDGSPLETVGANVTTYDDLTAAPGVTYEYCVSAYNDCGESAQCCDNGTRLSPPAAPTDCAASDDLCDKVTFTWTDNSDNETGFYIYRDGSPLETVGANVTTYDDLTAAPGVTYEYCVSAYNDCGESSQCCDNGTAEAEAVAVSAPNGGEEWCVGTSQEIAWTFACIDTVRIDYSTDGGSSWLTEADKVPAAPGVYPWTVPDAPSENCLVRICDAEDGTPCDQSDAVFTICVQDFTIEVSPARRKLLTGHSITYTVLLTSVEGFASPCTLTVTGLPADASDDFAPNPIVPTDSSVMTIYAAETTPPGYYDLTVTATEIGNGMQHSAPAVLTVSGLEVLVFAADHSLLDLIVTDPAGDSIGADFSTILGASYSASDPGQGCGDQITIAQPLAGEYHVRVIPESGANDDDVFSLWAKLGPNDQVFLAADAPVPPEGESADYAYPYLTHLPGDANADSYRNLADVVHLLNYLFRNGATPNPMEAGDSDCDGSVDLGDAMHLLNYLFKEGPLPGC